MDCTFCNERLHQKCPFGFWLEKAAKVAKKQTFSGVSVSVFHCCLVAMMAWQIKVKINIFFSKLLTFL